jgi:hypothetical protein
MAFFSQLRERIDIMAAGRNRRALLRRIAMVVRLLVVLLFPLFAAAAGCKEAQAGGENYKENKRVLQGNSRHAVTL